MIALWVPGRRQGAGGLGSPWVVLLAAAAGATHFRVNSLHFGFFTYPALAVQ